jgi:hypothetical protein
MCACEWGCCAIRIPHAKPLVPIGTSSPELTLASWHHASLQYYAFCHHLRLLFVLVVVVKWREGIELTNRFPVHGQAWRVCGCEYQCRFHAQPTVEANMRYR